MRITLPLCPTVSLLPTATGAPPLAFIDSEPFLIELQGSLDFPQDVPTSTQINIGRLDLSVPTKPILQIAHHRLEGTLHTLTEPFALLRSQSSSTQSAKKQKHDGNVAAAKEIEIVALIRRKILFSKRPEPIVVLSSEPNWDE